ncbi:MAG: hypothetical protein Q9225_000496 [Loekoesia sp. 1 TL-2023]
MADPFGCIAVAETGLRLGLAIGKIVQALQSAPDELLALSNEVCDLRLTINGVRQTIATCVEPREWPGVEPLLFQASIRFDQVDKIVRKLGQLGPYGTIWNLNTWDRLLWQKEKGKVITLQKQLRAVRSNLALTLGTHSSFTTNRIAIDLQELLLQTSQIHSSHTGSLEKHRECLEDLTRRVSPTMEELRSTQEETKALLEALLQAVPKISLQDSLSPAENARSTASAQPRPVEKMNAQSFYPAPAQAIEKSQELAPVAIPVHNTLADDPTCWSGCACQCHRRNSLKSPEVLRKISGQLFLGYNGSLVFQQRCNVPNCRTRSATSPQVSYYFPKWFVQKAITISMTKTAFGTPNLNLKVRRVVSEMSDLFRLSRFGDVEGCQTLFSKQQASPDDVNPIGGWTALHFAVDHGSVEFCRLLIQQGADPNWEDASGMRVFPPLSFPRWPTSYILSRTALEIARRNVLQPRVAPRAAEIYSVLVPRADRLQERYFSRLHELILELATGDIEEEIRSNPSSVEAVDTYGWTPLHWAVRRDDAHALDILLRHGANPFVETGDDQASPIHLAARADSASCVQRLLQARYQGKAVEINGWDQRGRTPLRIAAGNNCVACTVLLIQMGAEIDNPDRQNETALLSAVYESAHETIPMLIKAGANTRATTRSGNTILHFAANESDLRTLTLLTRARMYGVDIEARNNDGLTARELAVNRIGAPHGFIEAFDRLIASILDTDWSSLMSASVMSDQESFKSFEELVWFETEAVAAEDVQEAMRVVTEYRASQSASPIGASRTPDFLSPSSALGTGTSSEENLLQGIEGHDMLKEKVQPLEEVV